VRHEACRLSAPRRASATKVSESRARRHKALRAQGGPTKLVDAAAAGRECGLRSGSVIEGVDDQRPVRRSRSHRSPFVGNRFQLVVVIVGSDKNALGSRGRPRRGEVVADEIVVSRSSPNARRGSLSLVAGPYRESHRHHTMSCERGERGFTDPARGGRKHAQETRKR